MNPPEQDSMMIRDHAAEKLRPIPANTGTITTTTTAPRQRYTRRLRWMVAILSALLVLSLGLLLAKDPLLKKLAESRIYQQTGLRAEIGRLHVALWKAAIEVRDLKIHNGPEFGDRPLLHLPELSLEMDSAQARQGKFRFKTVRLDVAELNVVRSKAGAYNIESLNKRASSASKSTPGSGTGKRGRDLEFAGIDLLQLSVDKIRYTDLKRPKRSREIDVGIWDERITGLNSEDEVKAWAASFLLQILMREYILK